MAEKKIKDLDSVGNENILRFNIKGLAPTIGTQKHVTAIKLCGRGVNFEISGMLALDENGEVTGETVKEQAIIIVANIATAIQGAASHYEKELSLAEALNYITTTTIQLKEMNDFCEVNEAYIHTHMPGACRATYAVKELPLANKGTKVQIQASAFLPLGDKKEKKLEKTDELLEKLRG
jgi:enamine deaminase RidA (YjgF/YER057c/UK114 family)